MQSEASIGVPLMERQVCNGCGHLHRDAINASRNSLGRIHDGPVLKCVCCDTDGGKEQTDERHMGHLKVDAYLPGRKQEAIDAIRNSVRAGMVENA